MESKSQVIQLFTRAEEAFKKKNYDYARDLFKQIITVNPDHADARKALRATIIKKYQEQGGPSKFTLKVKLAAVNSKIAVNKTKPAKLLSICQNFLVEDPNAAKVRGVLAGALMNLKSISGAAVEAEMALEGDPHNIPAAKVLVSCYQSLGKIREAQVILAKVCKHAPDDRDLARLQRDLAAAETMKKGFHDTGDKGFRSSLKNTEAAEDLEKRQHLVHTDDDIQQEIAKLESEMKEDPNEPRLPKKIGDLLFERKKDFKSARDWYKKALDLSPQDSVLRDKVDDCGIRQYDVQIAVANKKGDPKLAELKANRLKFYMQSFERRIADRPTDLTLRFELGKAYLQAGSSFLDKAIGQFQQSVKDPKRKLDSHIHLGQAFQKKKLFDLADGQYRKAEEGGVVQQSRLLYIWYGRALCLAEAGNFDKALELGQNILELDIGYKDISQRLERWQAAKV